MVGVFSTALPFALIVGDDAPACGLRRHPQCLCAVLHRVLQCVDAQRNTSAAGSGSVWHTAGLSVLGVLLIVINQRPGRLIRSRSHAGHPADKGRRGRLHPIATASYGFINVHEEIPGRRPSRNTSMPAWPQDLARLACDFVRAPQHRPCCRPRIPGTSGRRRDSTGAGRGVCRRTCLLPRMPALPLRSLPSVWTPATPLPSLLDLKLRIRRRLRAALFGAQVTAAGELARCWSWRGWAWCWGDSPEVRKLHIDWQGSWGELESGTARVAHPYRCSRATFTVRIWDHVRRKTNVFLPRHFLMGDSVPKMISFVMNTLRFHKRA